MCHGALEAVAAHCEYIDRKTKNIFFTPPISFTQIQPNLLLRCPRTRKMYMPNLKQIAPANLEI